MRTWTVVGIAMLAAVGGGCAARQSWSLVYPPDVVDESYPRGTRLLPQAPVAQWRVRETYRSEAECIAARDVEWAETIDRAHAAHGDDAKHDVGVRRIVHSRCVESATVPAPAP